MSRTDISASALAKWLRRVTGDGSIEWVTTPMHSNVLLDVADLLDENAKLRELIKDLKCAPCCGDACWMKLTDRMRELRIEVNE